MLVSGLFLASCNAGTSSGVDERFKSSLVAKGERDKLAASEGPSVRVFKYDGSLQCGMGHAVPLEKMKIELANIVVQSQEKKSDGLMSVQMCGSPTGYANVYQIDSNELEKSKRKRLRAVDIQLIRSGVLVNHASRINQSRLADLFRLL